jgi:hypothetical protein
MPYISPLVYWFLEPDSETLRLAYCPVSAAPNYVKLVLYGTLWFIWEPTVLFIPSSEYK